MVQHMLASCTQTRGHATKGTDSVPCTLRREMDRYRQQYGSHSMTSPWVHQRSLLGECFSWSYHEYSWAQESVIEAKLNAS